MGLLLKFAGVFAALGLLISIAFGFLGGNRWTAVVTTALLCTALSGGLGVGVLKVLEARVPEFLRIFEGMVALDEENAPDAADFAADQGDVFGEGVNTGTMQPVTGQAGESGGAKHFGDHILVNKVKIKNEPRLMAEAIKTMLARDEE